MIEYYAQIRLVHISAVLASGTVFFLRGLGVHSGAQWPTAAPLRYLSYAIDTTLLAAALMLMTIVQQYPFVHGWLTVKILLLVVYIVLGTYALRRGRTRKLRIIYWVSALLIFGFIVTIARAHHSIGIFAQLADLH